MANLAQDRSTKLSIIKVVSGERGLSSAVPHPRDVVMRKGFIIASELFDAVRLPTSMPDDDEDMNAAMDPMLEALIEPLVILAWDRKTKQGRLTKDARIKMHTKMLEMETRYGMLREATDLTPEKVVEETLEYYNTCEEFERVCRPFACGEILLSLERVRRDREAINQGLMTNADCK